MEIELVLDDIERLVRNIRTFTSVLKDMQNICDNMDPKKPVLQKKSKKTQTEPVPLADLKPVEAELPEALVCEPIKKSKKMRKPKLERS